MLCFALHLSLRAPAARVDLPLDKGRLFKCSKKKDPGFFAAAALNDKGRQGGGRLAAQFCEQGFCVFQVGGVQAFGELIVDFGERGAGLVSTIGVA